MVLEYFLYYLFNFIIMMVSDKIAWNKISENSLMDAVATSIISSCWREEW